MRSSVAIMLLSGLAIAACSKSEDKPTTTTTSASVTAATTTVATTVAATVAPAATQPSAVVASSDMNAFMAMLDGKEGSARKALKKYAASAIQNDDVGMYNLTNPKVTKADKVGDLQCYTMESTAGVMTHTTQTCWDAKGKITKLTDTSQ